MSQQTGTTCPPHGLPDAVDTPSYRPERGIRRRRSGTEAAKCAVMNDLGNARRGQKTLAEAASDVAGDFGIDFVAELVFASAKGLLFAFLPQSKDEAAVVKAVPAKDPIRSARASRRSEPEISVSDATEDELMEAKIRAAFEL
jgi:hypothetical protein